MRHPSKTRLGCALALVLGLTACGSNGRSPSSASATAADAPHVAARANEPRTGDPTAAAPTPMQPTSGSTAPVTPAPAGEPLGTAGDPKPAPAETTPPKKISARHVLIQWMGSERAAPSIVRSQEQAHTLAVEVLKRARAGEDFARLAVEYSDEPGAGGRGGSLGRFGHGQMVPAFEEAAFKLAVGQISDIVETPFGYHIIQRTE